MGKLDNPGFCTLLTAVDDHYLDKLMMTYPTWVKCHPEILRMDHLIIYDSSQVSDQDQRFDQILDTGQKESRSVYQDDLPNFKLVPWGWSAESQREKMLTALVHAVKEVDTPWYWKLDADTFASRKCGFYYDKWFRGNPAFIANPWGYTKPGTALDDLNAWAQTIPQLREYPPVEGKKIVRPQDVASGHIWKVNHRRMASWTMFGRTAWTQWAISLLDDIKLPFPSQDTYLSYLAALTKQRVGFVKFRQYGWEHCRNVRGLKNACDKSLGELDER